MYKFIETWDLWHYFNNASLFVQTGKIHTEYPLAAMIPISIPRLFTSDFPTYVLYYYLFMFLCVLGTSWFIHKEGKQPWLYILTVALLFPLSFGVFDLFVSMVFFLSLFYAGRHFIVGALLYLFSISIKLYPLVFLPLFFWDSAVNKRWLFYIAAGIIGFTVVFTDVNFLSFHKDRTVQPEALYTNVLYLQGERPDVIYSHNAMALKDIYTPLHFTLGLLTLGVIRSLLSKTYTEAAYYSILGFILANGVFSPQYLLWLAPFVPFVKKRIQVLFISATLLTTLYLGYYTQTVHFEAPYYMFLFVRNALLFFTLFL